MADLLNLNSLARSLREPRRALRAGIELLRGRVAIWWHRLRRVRVEGGHGLRLEGRLVIRGPGRVILGDGIRVGMVVTPWTYHPDAVISIGRDSYLNGTTFGCRLRIAVGDRAILGASTLMDTDFHSTHVNRHDSEAPVREAPIEIADNVWIAASAGILPGTFIGRNSVVGFGAVCSGAFPADSIIVGNPARVVKQIPGSGRPPD